MCECCRLLIAPYCVCVCVCADDLPKPQITVQPVSTVSVLGQDVRLSCTAASSSSSPMTFAWRKDQEPLRHAELENYAHVRGPGPAPVPAPGPAPVPAAVVAPSSSDGTATPAPSSSSVSVAPALAHGNVMEYTTVLHLRHVTFAHEGRYQCVITNHFGSSYSQKARLTVNGKTQDERALI